MKYTMVLLFTCITFAVSHAQDKVWSAELYYPLSIGEAFGASNQGLFGLGLKYRFASSGNWRYGASLDGSWFATEFVEDSDPIQIDRVRDLFMQPRLFAALPVNKTGKLQLLGGLGPTFYRFKVENLVGDERISEEKEWNIGFNINMGFSYDISTRWFLHSQLDLILISGYNPNSTLTLIKIGGGYRF